MPLACENIIPYWIKKWRVETAEKKKIIIIGWVEHLADSPIQVELALGPVYIVYQPFT